ncbi:hypothetical protein GGS26DRAFT_544189 [Hypomontagnella submonticulosa]|nr:hypothetical protein GGS26DRAFT_544189 [Hypomontagnella submonticulosa]
MADNHPEEPIITLQVGGVPWNGPKYDDWNPEPPPPPVWLSDIEDAINEAPRPLRRIPAATPNILMTLLFPFLGYRFTTAALAGDKLLTTFEFVLDIGYITNFILTYTIPVLILLTLRMRLYPTPRREGRILPLWVECFIFAVYVIADTIVIRLADLRWYHNTLWEMFKGAFIIFVYLKLYKNLSPELPNFFRHLETDFPPRRPRRWTVDFDLDALQGVDPNNQKPSTPSTTRSDRPDSDDSGSGRLRYASTPRAHTFGNLFRPEKWDKGTERAPAGYGDAVKEEKRLAHLIVDHPRFIAYEQYLKETQGIDLPAHFQKYIIYKDKLDEQRSRFEAP